VRPALGVKQPAERWRVLLTDRRAARVRVVLEDRDRTSDLAAGLHRRLADLAHDQPANSSRRSAAEAIIAAARRAAPAVHHWRCASRARATVRLTSSGDEIENSPTSSYGAWGEKESSRCALTASCCPPQFMPAATACSVSLRT
jgi:hypothetical protein